MDGLKESSERTLLNMRNLLRDTNSIYEELTFPLAAPDQYVQQVDTSFMMLSGIQYFIRVQIPYQLDP